MDPIIQYFKDLNSFMENVSVYNDSLREFTMNPTQEKLDEIKALFDSIASNGRAIFAGTVKDKLDSFHAKISEFRALQEELKQIGFESEAS